MRNRSGLSTKISVTTRTNGGQVSVTQVSDPSPTSVVGAYHEDSKKSYPSSTSTGEPIVSPNRYKGRHPWREHGISPRSRSRSNSRGKSRVSEQPEQTKDEDQDRRPRKGAAPAANSLLARSNSFRLQKNRSATPERRQPEVQLRSRSRERSHQTTSMVPARRIPASHISSIHQVYGPDCDIYRDIFGLPPQASERELRIAYFREGRHALAESKSLQQGAPSNHVKSRFQAVSLAYEVATVPEWRRSYELYGWQQELANDVDVRDSNTRAQSSISSGAPALRSAIRSQASERARSHGPAIRWSEEVEELVYNRDPQEEKDNQEAARASRESRKQFEAQAMAYIKQLQEKEMEGTHPFFDKKKKKKVVLEGRMPGDEYENDGNKSEQNFMSMLLNDIDRSLDGLEASLDEFVSIATPISDRELASKLSRDSSDDEDRVKRKLKHRIYKKASAKSRNQSLDTTNDTQPSDLAVLDPAPTPARGRTREPRPCFDQEVSPPQSVMKSTPGRSTSFSAQPNPMRRRRSPVEAIRRVIRKNRLQSAREEESEITAKSFSHRLNLSLSSRGSGSLDPEYDQELYAVNTSQDDERAVERLISNLTKPLSKDKVRSLDSDENPRRISPASVASFKSLSSSQELDLNEFDAPLIPVNVAESSAGNAFDPFGDFSVGSTVPFENKEVKKQRSPLLPPPKRKGRERKTGEKESGFAKFPDNYGEEAQSLDTGILDTNSFPDHDADTSVGTDNTTKLVPQSAKDFCDLLGTSKTRKKHQVVGESELGFFSHLSKYMARVSADLSAIGATTQQIFVESFVLPEDRVDGVLDVIRYEEESPPVSRSYTY